MSSSRTRKNTPKKKATSKATAKAKAGSIRAREATSSSKTPRARSNKGRAVVARSSSATSASSTRTTKRSDDGSASTAALIHRDLEVHREELAAQNEELRQANAALITAKERYAELYEGAPIAYFTLDEDGMIIETNLAGATLLEASRNFVFGRSFDEIVVPSSRESFRNFRRRVIEHGGHPVHETMLNKGGQRFHVHIEAARLSSPTTRSGSAGNDADGGDVGTTRAHCLLCVSDETQRRQLEEERRLLEKRIAEADRVESLGLLAGGMAHDFNNLLATALVNADLLLDDLQQQRSEQADGRVVTIRDTMMRAEHLSKQMLAYTGLVRLKSEPLDINVIVRSMSDALASTTPENVSLHLELGDALPLIEGESPQIREIVANLVRNAAEAIGPGEGKILLRTRSQSQRAATSTPLGVSPPNPRVSSSSLRDSSSTPGLEPEGFGSRLGLGLGSESAMVEKVVIEVIDNGRGMDEATRHRAFDPFFSTKVAGRGLGLAVVHGNVRAHGGTVEVDSRLHGGSSFRVFLPTARSSSALGVQLPPEHRRRRGHANDASTDGDGRHRGDGDGDGDGDGGDGDGAWGSAWRGSGLVLLVDQDEAARAVVGRVLEYVGFDVCHAVDGIDALGVVSQRSKALVAVLLDLDSSTTSSTSTDGHPRLRMSSHDALIQLKQLAPTLPVILASASSSAATIDGSARTAKATQNAKADGFLPKPFTLATLVRVMQRAIAQPQHTSSS